MLMPEWNSDDIERLLLMWPRKAASEIAAEIGRTRSAVCGKVGRLQEQGLIKRGQTKHLDNDGRKNKPVKKRVRPKAVKMVEVPGTHPIAEVPPVSVEVALANSEFIIVARPCTILDLNSLTCRWPLDLKSPAVATFYCGAVPVEGRPYCAEHCLNAYSPAYAREH